jgi:hypothetical protein
LTIRKLSCYSSIERSLSLHWILHSGVMRYRKRTGFDREKKIFGHREHRVLREF